MKKRIRQVKFFLRLKRTTRNTFGWLLATMLIILGYVQRAKEESSKEGILTAVYAHNPNKKLLEKIVVWFKNNGYVFISSGQLIEILNNRLACPRAAVWISLDDGWKGNTDNVIPITMKHNIPITIYMYTSAVENGIFWWRSYREDNTLLSSEYHNIKAAQQLTEEERRQILEAVDRKQKDTPLTKDAMSIEDVKRIATIPQITIGSHTVTHPVLAKCTDAQIDFELSESKKKLEEWTGKAITTFSYPFGSFDDRVVQSLKNLGYELAATTVRQFVRPNEDRYFVPRTDIMDDGSFAENLCHALGVWEPVVNKMKHIIKRRG